jgi:hypothetical protein
MAQVIYTEPTDEIVDLVDKVRTAPESAVALVLNPGTTGFQTPLNVRLLHQLGSRAGKTVSVISGDPHIQELSRVGGLPTYASVPAFERGIQTIRPHPDDGDSGVFGAAAAGAAIGTGLGHQPPGPPPPPSRTTAGAAGAAAAGTRVAGRRRPLYFVAAGVALLGILLFFVVAPSAKVTITLAGTPLTASPTIQGSPDAANAGKADHIVTSVVTSHQSAQFTATPTGQQPVPATAATATMSFSYDKPGGAIFPVSKGSEFDTQDATPVKLFATQAATICVGTTGGGPPATCPSGSQQTLTVQDGTAEAKGDVAANTITIWKQNPCNPANYPTPPTPPPDCTTSDLTVSNPAAATGGADAKTQVVASQSDVSSWTTQVTQSEQTLTNQVNQDMQTKAAGQTIAKDPGGNGSAVTCTANPAVPAANTVFAAAQITVACDGKATVYDPSDVTGDVKADLQAQVAQGDSLADTLNCTKPSVTQAAVDGTVVLSIQCTSFSKPAVDLNALKGQLTGKSPSDVKNLIYHRFNHVQSVSVSQSPIPFFWLPFFSNRIEIDEAFVTQTSQ